MKTTTKQMIGSEKQVAWATQIKAGWITSLNGLVAEARLRVEGGTMPAVWLEIVSEVCGGAAKKLDTWTTKQFIDNKNYPLVANASKAAIQQYTAVR